MSQAQKSKTLYALIIGINAYPRNQLYGCVNDALAVHEFCSQLAAVNEDIKDYQPKFLLAPHLVEDRSALAEHGLRSTDYESPTRNNIIKAFSHFKQSKAKSEDICLLYYSGHGSFQGAPEIFWNLKSGKQVESIVCVDSRTTGGRDLIDKELAFLLWDATRDKENREKGVHTLLIMDCCHSGDNTRGGSPVRSRMAVPNPTQTSLSDYVGYPESLDRGNATESEQRFLQALEKWRSARYVHLAAARDTETAKETMLEDRSSGVFTYSLLKTLRAGGMQLSYQELIERVKVMVRNRVEQQIPLLFATEPKDEQLTFMGGGLKEPVTEYIVSFDPARAVWVMSAGSNAGIVPSDAALGKTTVRAWRKNRKEETREAEVLVVRAAESELDGSAFSSDDQQHEDWVARITHMAAPTIKVFLNERVAPAARKELLEKIPKNEVTSYEFVEEVSEAGFIVYFAGGKYVLTKKDSNVPVFRRTPDPKVFLAALQSVGRWLRVLELENRETSILRRDIDLQVEIIEGTPLSLSNLNTVRGESPLDNPAEIKVSYKRQRGPSGKQLQPGLRVRLKTTNQPYFLSCLYLDSQYGITSNLDTTEIRPDGSGEWLRFTHQRTEYKTIPLSFDDNYHKLGITEITDYLKIFVSRTQFPVKGWEQNELELDDQLLKIAEVTRGTGLEEEEEFDNLGDWTCFTIPIKIRRPLAEQEQVVGGAGSNETRIGGSRLIVPQGFSARVSAAGTAQINDMINEAIERSVDGADNLRKTLLPPPLLWGSTPGSNAIFSRGVSAAGPDAQLSVLELTGALGDNVINRDNPIIFEPDGGVEEDEVLISFAYDEDSGMHLPLGFSDEDGQVRIENLPKETPGKIIGEAAVSERSLTGSIKLFFKKVVIGGITGQANTNTLAICSVDENGVSAATPVENGALADSQLKNICLLIHGIIGDTEVQRQAFFENESTLHQQFDAVISYDYENLNTPIEETAGLLKADLAKAGIAEAGGKRLTIVAHSMGGLVSRWFIEQEGGDQVVKRLIQLGTPNGGSETADFRKAVFGMMSMAMNGAVFLKPYLSVLALIGKRVSNSVFRTLDQMSPTASEFLSALNADGAPQSGVPYFIIGGDTGRIEPEDLDDQPLLKQFWTAVKLRAPYELLDKLVFKTADPNDMAVTQTSMKTVPTQSDLPFYNVASDHISYFNQKEAMQHLREIIKDQV